MLTVLGTSCGNANAAAIKAAPRISDARFEAAANQACKEAVGIFNTATTLGDQPTGAQSADFLDSIDATFASLVRRLRDLTPAAADQTAVDAWLHDWDSYVAFGHTYAQAVRTGSERDVIRNNTATQGQLRRRLQAFAVVNHMPACKFP